ncbi:DUF3159 domain-containing protein [Streptomyces armeniacus]|uniref:DUF3159 domain-containing protein n=1 Tax=Streptomyces armeniacus TaxID=83291 RepID=A0A345XUP1_9ACTN|nr:DUF3159 domain-containing protein [Streptomyces armeniacus]AXK35357.1 DUF3159 domain-containing protein [Streptomyces armeniacus]
MTSLDKPTGTDRDGPSDQDGPDANGLPDAHGRSDANGASDAHGPSGSHALTEAALFEAFGGVRGLVETTVPGLVFILIFTINKDLHVAAVAALVLSGLLGVARLVRRDTLKHAFSGVFGVLVGVVFAMVTGNAKDFYLPGMLYGLGLALAYLVSAAVGYPLLGLLLGPVFKENLSWRTRNPGRKRAYVKASYAWGFIFLGKSAILFPLYWWADPTRFGWVTVALKIPPLLLAVYLTWIFLAKAPPPINVIAEMEAEEEAEERAKAAASTPTDGAPRHRRD